MKSLEGKRVLFIAPRFFGYEHEVRAEFERRGAQVDWVPDRPFDSPVMAAVTRLAPKLIFPAADRRAEQLLTTFGASRYDLIFVINGQTLSFHMLARLRASFPMAKVVLYMWDSIENRRGVLNNLPLFDEVFSFDPLSAVHYGMQLRPLFFSKGFEQAPQASFDYHLSFVGTAHSDRYSVIQRLRGLLPADVSAYWFLYLQAPWVFHAYRLRQPMMRNASRDEFSFAPLAKETVQAIFARSLAVVDIEHPQQRGLTMRTFETVGAHKKLITTNAQVKEYDFYDAANICVIDRQMPVVPAEFLGSPYVPLPAALYQRYSIAGWLDEVIGLAPQPEPLSR